MTSTQSYKCSNWVAENQSQARILYKFWLIVKQYLAALPMAQLNFSFCSNPYTSCAFIVFFYLLIYKATCKRLHKFSLSLFLVFHISNDWGFTAKSHIIHLVDNFLTSHHLSADYCFDIVRRNSFLVNYGGERLILFDQWLINEFPERKSWKQNSGPNRAYFLSGECCYQCWVWRVQRLKNSKIQFFENKAQTYRINLRMIVLKATSHRSVTCKILLQL